MIRAQLRRAWAIALKDMRIYYLKPPMISWGFLFPLVMILAFYLRDPRDIRQVAPGLIGMTVLFTSTSMQAVVISFEKRIGAMERLLMAPVAPVTLLVGKACSGVAFGALTGLAIWVVSHLVWGIPLHPGVLLVLLLGSIVFALLGQIVSLLMREVFDAMTMANLFRFPMIFLGGVFMPVGQLAGWLRPVALLFPLTYTVDALRHLLLGGEGAYLPLGVDLLASLGFAVGLYLVSWRLLMHRLEDLL